MKRFFVPPHLFSVNGAFQLHLVLVRQEHAAKRALWRIGTSAGAFWGISWRGQPERIVQPGLHEIVAGATFLGLRSEYDEKANWQIYFK